jgi:hypothetical protein
MISRMAGITAIVSLAGIMLVEVFTNRPAMFDPDQITGRVCPALYLARPSSYWLYYTTPTYCAVSWGFAGILFLAGLFLLIGRNMSR